MAATLQWFSGAELGSTEFDAYSNGGGGLPTHVTSPVRTGTYSLKTPHDALVRSRNQISSTTTTFLRQYFKIAAAPTNTVAVLVINNANFSTSRGWRVYLTSTGKIGWAFNATSGSAPDGTGATSIDTSGWNLLEIKLVRDASVGGMEIYLNGVQQVSDFTHSTTTGTSATIWNLWFGNDTDQPGTNQSGQDIYWDDMAFATVDYIGAGGSIAVQGKAGAPTYDAWTKNGDTTAALCWSETPFSNTKNCSDTTPTDRQTMLVNDTTLNSLVPSDAIINGAMVRAVIKTATSGSVKSTHRIGGVDTDGTDVTLSTVDRVFPSGLNSDPQGIFTDTRANLGAAEIGFVRGATGSGNAVTVEDVWLLVDWAPSPNISITPSAGALTLTGQLADRTDTDSPTIRPGSGALGLTGYEPGSNRKTPARASLALTGTTPTVRVTEALQVVFSIIEPTASPLTVLFDIQDAPASEPDPLTVLFDIVEANSGMLTVMFDIVSGDLVARRMSKDIQGPVAKVVLS